MLSILDIFKIGIGPSSSHTVGPMRAGVRFLKDAEAANLLDRAARVSIELQGSLALTGIGHGTDKAVLLGLSGCEPDTVDPDDAERIFKQVLAEKQIHLLGQKTIVFEPRTDLDFRGDLIPKAHPNGLRLILIDAANTALLDQTYYSVGGGFIATARQLEAPADDDQILEFGPQSPHPFKTAADLLALCDQQQVTIADLVLRNEDVKRPREKTFEGLDAIWAAMRSCIDRGLRQEGILPGGLDVERRAPSLLKRLECGTAGNERESLFDWLNLYAMAVNEENAAGGRVVTAPTNGAAGIIPAILKHYCDSEGASPEKIRTFLLTAGAIGLLYKQRASISGAEMGCQGEVGVACSMAAAGLAAVWEGTPRQIEHAAEIGMEHNLGLTCDPVGGLVQIPCIERNAIGAVKAVNAARLSLYGSGDHKVTLDQVIETMRQTGLDMSSKYKETSEGGLAVNVVAC